MANWNIYAFSTENPAARGGTRLIILCLTPIDKAEKSHRKHFVLTPPLCVCVCMYMYYVSVYEEDVNMLLLALKNNIILILFFPLPQHLSDPHYLPTPPPSFMFFLSIAQNSQNQKQTKKQRKTK